MASYDKGYVNVDVNRNIYPSASPPGATRDQKWIALLKRKSLFVRRDGQFMLCLLILSSKKFYWV